MDSEYVGGSHCGEPTRNDQSNHHAPVRSFSGLDFAARSARRACVLPCNVDTSPLDGSACRLKAIAPRCAMLSARLSAAGMLRACRAPWKSVCLACLSHRGIGNCIAHLGLPFNGGKPINNLGTKQEQNARAPWPQQLDLTSSGSSLRQETKRRASSLPARASHGSSARHPPLASESIFRFLAALEKIV
jgi:hypothetical protein